MFCLAQSKAVSVLSLDARHFVVLPNACCSSCQELGAEVLRILFRNASLFRWFVAADDDGSTGGPEDDSSLDQRPPQRFDPEIAASPAGDGGDRHRHHRRRTSATRPPPEAEAPGGAGAVQGFGVAGEMTMTRAQHAAAGGAQRLAAHGASQDLSTRLQRDFGMPEREE